MTLDANGNEIEELHQSVMSDQGMEHLFAHRDEEGNRIQTEVFDSREVFEEQVLPIIEDLMKKCADLNLPVICMVQFQRTRDDPHRQEEGIMFSVSNPTDLRAGILHRGVTALIVNPTELTIQPTMSSIIGLDIDDLFTGESEEGNNDAPQG